MREKISVSLLKGMDIIMWSEDLLKVSSCMMSNAGDKMTWLTRQLHMHTPDSYSALKCVLI